MEREVILDGELVDFQGQCPETADSVWGIVENHLGGSGRLIRSFSVDGQDWRIDEGGGGDFRRIEILSSSQAAEFGQALGSLLESRAEVLAAWERFGAMSLSSDRAGSLALGSEALELTRGAIEFWGLAVSWGKGIEADWAASLDSEYARLNECLGSWMDALERFDPVVLSDLAAGSVGPALEALYSISGERLKTDLERRDLA